MRRAQNPAKCSLDPKSLICKPGEKDDCLNADQVLALETYFSPTRDENGHELFPGSANTDLESGGMKMVAVSPDDQKLLQQKLAPVAEQWAKSLDGRGKAGGAVLKDYQAAIASGVTAP